MSIELIDELRQTEFPVSPPGKPRPTWEIALLYPSQGEWSEAEYLDLERIRGDHIRVELVDGCLEVLPAPTTSHQAIIIFFLIQLREFVAKNQLGQVSFAGIRVRLRDGNFREPDVVFLKKQHLDRCLEEYWEGADLVMEVVSGSSKDRKRDYEDKVKDYAEAGIPEYWIVDPDEKRIRVLTLDGTVYKLYGDFGPGSQATSVLLPGFAVQVNEALRGED